MRIIISEDFTFVLDRVLMASRTKETTGNTNGNGVIEGVARSASQACVYLLEFNKTQLQVYGHIPRYTPNELVGHLSKGIVSSTISAGFVYSAYFSIYNQFPNKAFAGVAATLVTSVIKIPIANSMRVLQTKNHPHVFSAGKSILKAQGIHGIYSGYSLSLVDDYFDMEVRLRIYSFLRNLIPEKDMNPSLGLMMGAISGSIAAAVTTPLDTIRCHLAVASVNAKKKNMFLTINHMMKTGGLPIFIRGIGYRASSNALRTALFYLFYEILLSQQEKNKCTKCR